MRCPIRLLPAVLLPALGAIGCEQLLGSDRTHPPAGALVSGSAGEPALDARNASGAGGSAGRGPVPDCDQPSPGTGTLDDPAIAVRTAAEPVGVDDPLFCLAPRYPLARMADGLPTPTSPFRAGFRAIWSERDLTVLVDTEDDALYSGGFFSYEDDNVTLGLVPTAAADSALAGSETVILVGLDDNNAGAPESAPARPLVEVLVQQARLSTGWRVSIRVPWSVLGDGLAAPGSGDRLRISVGSGDVDGGVLSGQYAWQLEDVEGSYKDPPTWPWIQLRDAP